MDVQSPNRVVVGIDERGHAFEGFPVDEHLRERSGISSGTLFEGFPMDGRASFVTEGSVAGGEILDASFAVDESLVDGGERPRGDAFVVGDAFDDF